MTNIFNKTVLVKNGTLMGNWYEEQILREKTGEGRTIPGQHIPKRTMNFDKEIINPYKKDQTFSRILGENLEVTMKTSSETYGDFSDNINKYQNKGVKEKVFEDFYKTWVNNEEVEKNKLEESIKNIRLYDTTNRNLLMTKSPEYGSIGKRHMQTQDFIPIDNKSLDRLFMASHDMSKFPTVIPESKANQYVDRFVPYYKDKEITFWSMNQNKGNVYRSHTLGQNAFAKSSGFTQPVQASKGVKQFSGNVTSSCTAKNLFLNEHDDEFIQKYKMAVNEKESPQDLLAQILGKIYKVLVTKGWLGLRKLRLYLKSLSKRSSDFIDRNDFKYYFINFGINLTEKEVEYIFNEFDHRRNDQIDYNEFLDKLHFFSLERQDLVKNFFAQLKNTNQDQFVSFKKMEKLVHFDQHPEALCKDKSSNEIKFEYLTTWNNLKEDNLVKEENFVKFFKDVSSVIQRDEVFIGCLNSCGMQ